jgi:hypothetical protein
MMSNGRQIPFPAPQGQVDISTWREIQCLCGGKELQPEVRVMIRYNPFKPEEIAQIPLNKMVCSACGLFLAQSKDAKGFVCYGWSRDGINPLTETEELEARKKHGGSTTSLIES